ncbi:Zinc finger CCCH domain-containing protein 7B [Orchesella cincta]|uniref:Zinc finger CCCH domain-containing protein 7B n=1 Tax=Orchesella cincta TaxID=48709 RepID=A0A1D2N6Z4_ORCCI|nr:Zinc finger CCCH domain-containing protein 7B [Orchesella cincta]
MNETNRFGTSSDGNAKVANGKCDGDSNKLNSKAEEESDDDVGSSSSRNPQFFLKEGNMQFIYKNFTSAISTYTHGLDLFNEELCGDHPVVVVENEPDKKIRSVSGNTNENRTVILELFTNRALAYLSIGNYTAALEDTQKALSINPTHFKAIFRKAKALAGLAQYQNAIGFVESSLKRLTKKNKQESVSDCKELSAYLEKLRRMKQQSEAGDYYDVPYIMERLYEPTPADWVDYIGPVKVEKFPGKGRGLVAAQDIPPCKLILACRAFEIIFLDTGSPDPEECLSQESKKALFNGDIKVEDDRTLNFLARKIYDRLVRNPEKRVDFYQLHAGT